MPDSIIYILDRNKVVISYTYMMRQLRHVITSKTSNRITKLSSFHDTNKVLEKYGFLVCRLKIASLEMHSHSRKKFLCNRFVRTITSWPTL